MDYNILAIIAGAIASMVLGSIWYGPLFGKHWAKEMGFNMSDPAMKAKAKRGYVGGFVGAIITASVLTYFIASSFEWAGAMKVAFLLWLGFVVTVQLGGVWWNGRTWKSFWIDAIYSLLNLMIIGSVLFYWV